MNSAPERRPIDVGAWNSIVDLWQDSWSSFADPARQVVAAATALAPGTSVLDLGCGSGEFLALAAGRGADVAGIDDAEAMIAAARRRVPDADLRVGSIERAALARRRVRRRHRLQRGAVRRRPPRGAGRGAPRRPQRRARRGVRLGRRPRLRGRGRGHRARTARRRSGGRARVRVSGSPGSSTRSPRTQGCPCSAPRTSPCRSRSLTSPRCSGRSSSTRSCAARSTTPASRPSAPTVADAAAPYRRPDGSYRFENVFRVVVARAWGGSYRLR